MIRTLAQLHWMTLRGRTVRSLRLLRQPKYFIGVSAGALWLLFWVGGPLLRSGMDWEFAGMTAVRDVAHDLLPTIHRTVAVVVTFMITLPWFLPWGRRGVGFREAELTMLLQAPISRRQLIDYGLLKATAVTVINAGVLVLLFGSGGPFARLRGFLGLFLFLWFWNLNSRWHRMFLLRQAQLPRPVAALRRVALTAGLLALWSMLIVGLLNLELPAILRNTDIDLLVDEIAVRPWPSVLLWLSWPGRLLTAPLFASGWGGFALAALPVLGMVVAQRELVLRSPARFEEGALEHARQHAGRKSPTRRFKRLSGRARVRQVFDLSGRGAPEIAIAWKNMMRVTRIPIAMWAAILLLLMAAIVAVPPLLGLPESSYFIVALAGLFAVWIPVLMVGAIWHNDMRNEFGHIELLRTWPVAPTRFLAAQVAAPAALSFLASLAGVGLVLSAWIGTRWLERVSGIRSELSLFPDGALGVTSTLGLVLVLAGLIPLCAGGAFASSAMQNLAVLFVPAWLAEEHHAERGIAAFGRRLVFGIGVFIAFSLAMIPGAILVGLAVLAQILLDLPWSAWAFPLWGMLAAAPLFVGGWFVILVAARLWRDLDPSDEVLEIGA